MRLILIILLFISSLLFASLKPSETDKKIIELGLNYQFDEADKLLKQLFVNSNDIKNHYLYLNLELIKIIKATDDAPVNERQKVKESLNNKMIQYCEKIIPLYENKKLSIDEKFYLGSIYGLLGRFYGVNKSWMSAFSNGKNGKNILEEIIETDPNYTDAYLLLGMMYYYADRLSGVTKLITGVLGLSGDRKTGLEYLHKVDKYGVVTKWQATMILIELYSRLENNKFSALPLLEKMCKKFPNNSHFTNWYCYELMNANTLNVVGKIINSDNANNINEIVKAQYFHLTGEYGKSNEILTTLFKDENKIFPWIYEYSKYMRAVNYYMLNDTESSRKIINGLNEDFKNYYSKLFINYVFSKNLLKYREYILKDDFIKAQDIKNEIDKNKLNDSQLAFISFFDGIQNYKEKNLTDAETNFIKSKNYNNEIYGSDINNYLINIYKSTNANKNNVEKLIEELEDSDDDRYEISIEELEEKYDL